jgi:hypothetical protein
MKQWFRKIKEHITTRRFYPDMAVVKIAWNNKPENMYAANAPNFAWVSKAENGMRKQVTGFMTCRESFIDCLRKQIESGKVTVPKNRVTFLVARAVSFSCTKLTKERFQKRFFEDMKRAVKIANVLEAHVGWTRTRMFATNGTPARRNAAAYLITGPAKWMRSPHLLSLYALIMRMGRFEAYDNVNTLEGFIQITEKIIDKKLGGQTLSGDRSWMAQTKTAWLPLMENINVVYKGFTLQRSYSRKYLKGDSGFSEGIWRLAKNRTCDLEVRKRWKDLKATLK